MARILLAWLKRGPAALEQRAGKQASNAQAMVANATEKAVPELMKATAAAAAAPVVVVAAVVATAASGAVAVAAAAR